MSTQLFPTKGQPSPLAKLGQQIALAGLVIYVLFAPHSVAGSAIGAGVAAFGWMVRTVRTGSLGLRRSKFDLIIILFLLWTAASAFLSEEPGISIPKLYSLWTVLLFYITRATLNTRWSLVLVGLLIVSGGAGALYSIFDLVRGRGVVVETITSNSPFHQVGVQPGDTIWRVNRSRIYSAEELDSLLKSSPPDVSLSVSIISSGEQVERGGFVLTAIQREQPSPSGITGASRNHWFRASGWTRHYQTFAEVMQMIVLIALGLALANFRNHGANRHFKLAIVAAFVLTLGLVFTAMRTVIVAFVIAASLISWRSLRATYKIVFTFALFFVLAFSAVVVWQTRDRNALLLGDPSSSLRLQVARVGLSRIPIHPIFGHGMDAMKLHWTEWGFPGRDMLHLHSTPLQLAFDRGLPLLGLWLWLTIALWLHVARTEKSMADLSDTNTYGIVLGTMGALTGFLVSSLVNYNWGDAEVVMLFWFLIGTAVSTDYTDSNRSRSS